MGHTIFTDINIGKINIKNRVVRSATWEGMASKKGEVTDKLLILYENLAKNEVGLIITSHAYVDPAGQASPWQLAVYSEEFVEGLKGIVDIANKYNSKVFLQIAHSGIFSISREVGLGPSDIEIKTDFRSAKGRAMTKEEIEGVEDKFAYAAYLAKEAGFHGVQIHSAHGYLLSQFLSPFFNKRDDEYGGNIENRSRIVINVYKKIREKVGSDYPVIIKLNCEDFLDIGMSFDEMLYVAKRLEDLGIDGIEMSGGTLISKELIPSRTKKVVKKTQEIYYLEHAKRFKKELNIPLILVGGMRRFDVCEELLQEGICDMVSMSRPLIREPNLIKRWMQGDIKDAQCESCNLCFKPALSGEGIYCYLEKKEKENKK